jgi:uncharacterized membrane protein YsdA (DUF1294 family)
MFKLLAVLVTVILAIPAYVLTGYYILEPAQEFSWGWRGITLFLWIALGGAPAAFVGAFVAQFGKSFATHEEAFKFLMPFVGVTVIILLLNIQTVQNFLDNAWIWSPDWLIGMCLPYLPCSR